MIYAYLAICTSMILFNLACVFVFRRRDTSLRRLSSRLETRVAEQLERVRAGQPVEERHKTFLQKSLRQTSRLLAFDDTLDRLLSREPEVVWEYLRQISPVFTCLAIENQYHSSIKLTYFAYVVRKYRILKGRPAGPVLDVMNTLLGMPSLYCRENALQAIYSSGNCGCVISALQAVDESPRFHHAKLLTDGLLTFPGDREQLSRELWRHFDRFSVKMRVVILDYFRFSGMDMQEQLLPLLADPRQDDEIRFSCIRYFGKYPCQAAYPLLLDFVNHPKGNRWEYAAISASALASYPGQHSTDVLKQALHSSNWYVRFNAAQSLERFHLTYLELSDTLDGNDRYAREILQYRMDLKNAREARKEAAV